MICVRAKKFDNQNILIVLFTNAVSTQCFFLIWKKNELSNTFHFYLKEEIIIETIFRAEKKHFGLVHGFVHKSLTWNALPLNFLLYLFTEPNFTIIIKTIDPSFQKIKQNS